MIDLVSLIGQEIIKKYDYHYFLSHQAVILLYNRSQTFWIVTLIFLIIYLFIALEVMHRTVAAMLGGSVIVFLTYTVGVFYPNFFLLSFQDAVKSIDINVIFLLLGMMIIVGVIKKTGVFQWLAYKSFKITQGNVFVLVSMIMFITAFISALLDNVTTILLVIPIILEIRSIFKINPVFLMLPAVFASNIGGTSTLIGDPPNMIIGSYAKLTFIDFFTNLGVLCFICLFFSIFWFLLWYKKDYAKVSLINLRHREYLYRLHEIYKITNIKLLFISIFVLFSIIFLFIIQGVLYIEPGISVLIGASILLILSNLNIIEILEKEIEWSTLIFLIFMFILIAGLKEAGFIQIVTDWIKYISKNNLPVAIMIILWASAIISAIIDNIPFIITMLPVVAALIQSIPDDHSGVLWWALALGGSLGGNGTMIGSSAGIITVSMAETAGYHISFIEYIKAAWWPMIINIILCTGWLFIIKL